MSRRPNIAENPCSWAMRSPNFSCTMIRSSKAMYPKTTAQERYDTEKRDQASQIISSAIQYSLAIWNGSAAPRS